LSLPGAEAEEWRRELRKMQNRGPVRGVKKLTSEMQRKEKCFIEREEIIHRKVRRVRSQEKEKK